MLLSVSMSFEPTLKSPHQSVRVSPADTHTLDECSAELSIVVVVELAAGSSPANCMLQRVIIEFVQCSCSMAMDASERASEQEEPKRCDRFIHSSQSLGALPVRVSERAHCSMTKSASWLPLRLRRLRRPKESAERKQKQSTPSVAVGEQLSSFG